MKAIRTRIQKHSRPLVILLAAAVAIITSIVVANATQTITTPNAAFIAYNLAAGLNSAAITPATNRSVLVMGCCTTVGGVGQVSLVHFPSNFIQWVGFDYRTAAFTAGFSSTAGTHIVYLDQVGVVDIQTASADTIRIQNGSGGVRAGNVTLVW